MIEIKFRNMDYMKSKIKYLTWYVFHSTYKLNSSLKFNIIAIAVVGRISGLILNFVHMLHMALHWAAIIEFLSTLLASKRDAGMGNKMSTQARSMIEYAMAYMTLVLRLRLSHQVHAIDMLCKISLLRKVDTAVRTAMAFHSCVDVHVSLKYLTLWKR